MELVSSDGDRTVVISALKTDRIEPTYNFEVAEFHTYFVGEAGVWVHNACEKGSEKLAKTIGKQLERDFDKDTRRAFHDEKMKGAGDRTVRELFDDAIEIYRQYNRNPPRWFR